MTVMSLGYCREKLFKIFGENWWIVDDDIWCDSSLGLGSGGVVYDE